MTVPPDIRLPESFVRTGDPQDSNPFPPSDRRHDVWTEATRAAEEEVCRIGVQPLERPKSFDELLDLVHPHDWLLNRQVAKFDVWAKRGVKVVWTDGDLALYDRWLLDYANAWLEELAQFLDHGPPPFSVEAALLEARNRFGGRVQFWRGEARRYRAKQEAHASASRAELALDVTPALIARRRQVVRTYRDEHDLTAVGFARKIGLSETAVLGIIKEEKNRFGRSTQDRFLAAIGIARADWYRE